MFIHKFQIPFLAPMSEKKFQIALVPSRSEKKKFEVYPYNIPQIYDALTGDILPTTFPLYARVSDSYHFGKLFDHYNKGTEKWLSNAANLDHQLFYYWLSPHASLEKIALFCILKSMDSGSMFTNYSYLKLILFISIFHDRSKFRRLLMSVQKRQLHATCQLTWQKFTSIKVKSLSVWFIPKENRIKWQDQYHQFRIESEAGVRVVKSSIIPKRIYDDVDFCFDHLSAKMQENGPKIFSNWIEQMTRKEKADAFNRARNLFQKACDVLSRCSLLWP